MTQLKVHGEPIWRPSDVQVGTVLVEGHNGVRHRVTAVHPNEHNWAYTIIDLVPIDNPLPVPRGNAPGRKSISFALANVLGMPEDMLEEDWRPSAAWRRLTGQRLINLDSAAYAREIGMACDQIEWVAYQPKPEPESTPVRIPDPAGARIYFGVEPDPCDDGSPDDRAAEVARRDAGPDRTYRAFRDESEAASGDNITLADESEWMD